MKLEDYPEEYRQWIIEKVSESVGLDPMGDLNFHYDIAVRLLEAGWQPPLSTEPIEVVLEYRMVEDYHVTGYQVSAPKYSKFINMVIPDDDEEVVDLNFKAQLQWFTYHDWRSITLRKEWVDD